MYRVKIYTVGKTKESWLVQAIDEYEKRLSPFLSVEWKYAKNSAGLLALLDKEKSFICLDPKGRTFSSEAFSKFIHETLLRDGSRLSFVIGAAEGLPSSLKERAKSLISLSPLTFTHDITRLILMEQLYRANEIDRGTAYHK